MSDIENIHFLIVDDDDVDVMAIKRVLINVDKDIAFSVAHNGEEALAFMQDNFLDTNDQKQLVVLLDLNMPRMTGHEFLNVIRSDPNLKSTVVFVLTTSHDSRDMQKSYEHYVSGYIPKDRLNADNFRGLLENYLSLVALPGTKI